MSFSMLNNNVYYIKKRKRRRKQNPSNIFVKITVKEKWRTGLGQGPNIVRAVVDGWLSPEVGTIPAPPPVTRERRDLKTVFFISSDIFSFEPN
jgi:hypothetical protein